MKIIFFGTPNFVLPVLQILHENFEVIGVVTTPDTIQGRKKILTPTPVKKYALENKIHITDLDQLNDHKQPDLFVVAAYGIIIPKSILNIPKYGSINIHPSLLPKYRGPSPIQTALLHGEKENGITIIEMDEEVDHGPILKKIPFSVEPSDTFQSLHIKMFQKAAKELPQVLKDYVNKNLTPTQQAHTSATFTERITKEDGYFNLDQPPSKKVLERMIRAYYPWPTAWTKIKIKNEELRLKLLPDNKIQLEGGKPMTLKDFYNGHPELKEKIEILLEE